MSNAFCIHDRCKENVSRNLNGDHLEELVQIG